MFGRNIVNLAGAVGILVFFTDIEWRVAIPTWSSPRVKCTMLISCQEQKPKAAILDSVSVYRRTIVNVTQVVFGIFMKVAHTVEQAFECAKQLLERHSQYFVGNQKQKSTTLSYMRKSF